MIFTQKNLFVDKEKSGHVFPLLAGSLYADTHAAKTRIKAKKAATHNAVLE